LNISDIYKGRPAEVNDVASNIPCQLAFLVVVQKRRANIDTKKKGAQTRASQSSSLTLCLTDHPKLELVTSQGLRIDQHSVRSATHTASQNIPGVQAVEGFVEMIIGGDRGALESCTDKCSLAP